MELKMGTQTWSFFGRLAFFFCAGWPWEPRWLPSLPQEPPRPVQASISIDFWLILEDFLMIFCIMWATFYLVCLIDKRIITNAEQTTYSFQTNANSSFPCCLKIPWLYQKESAGES